MNSLEDLPDDCTEIGNVLISVFTGPDGIGFAYGFQGLTPEAAIGYLIVTTDRLRNERGYEWDDDDLPPGEGLDDEEVDS